MDGSKFYPVIIRKSGVFCVHLAEWNISGEGNTIEEAYGSFESQLRATERRTEKFGLATISVEPYPSIHNPRFFRELGLFFTKAAAACTALIFTVILLLPPVLAAIRHHFLPRMDDALNRYAVELPTRLNERLDRVTPEQEKKIVEEWGRLLKRTSSLHEKIADQQRK